MKFTMGLVGLMFAGIILGISASARAQWGMAPRGMGMMMMGMGYGW